MSAPGAQKVALALDQSPIATGWAIGRPAGPRPVFGTFRLPAWGREEGARMAAYEQWLTGLAQEYRVTAIYYEAPFLPRHLNADAVMPQIHVISVINLVAAKLKLDVAQVPIDAWRKWAFGYCRIPAMKGDLARKEWKRLAKVACLKNNLLVEDDHAAEAALILDYGLSDADHGHRRGSEIRHSRAVLQHWRAER